MAYKLTRHSVLRNKPQLDQILASKGLVRFHTNNPAGLQRNIHEALAAAAEFPEFRHYSDRIKGKYSIRTKKGMVLVEPKDPVVVTKTEVLGEDRYEEVQPSPTVEPILPTDSPSSNIIPTEPKSETSQASTLPEVLMAILQAGDDLTDLIFPAASGLSLDEKRRLNKFCLDKKINFIDQEESGLTLTRRPVDPELLWREENDSRE